MSVKNAIAVIILAIAILPAAGAIAVGTSAASVEITACTQGAVGVWASGLQDGQTVSFSTEPGILIASFDSNSLDAGTSGTRGTTLHIGTPACYIGSKSIRVTAQTCGTTGCTTTAADVRVVIKPCAEFACAGYGYIDSPRPAADAASCGDVDCRLVYGNVQYNAIFQPPSYSVQIKRAKPATQVELGGHATAQYDIVNNGPSGTFTIKTSSSDKGITVIPGTAYVDIERDQKARVSIDVKAGSDAEPGLRSFTISVQQAGRQIAALNDRIQATEPAAPAMLPKLTVMAPAGGITLADCLVGPGIGIPARLDNTLSTNEYGIRAAIGGDVAFEKTLVVTAGESAGFTIDIPAAALRPGTNAVSIEATTGAYAGAQTVPITLASCSGKVSATAASSTAGDESTITVAISSALDRDIEAATARVEGIPASWSYSSTSATVPANGNANLTVKVTAATSDAAEPTIVVTSLGHEVARVKAQSINKAQDFTGFFTAMDGNSLLVAMLVVVAFVFIALYYHGRTAAQDDARQESEYRAKISALREKLIANEARRTAGDGATIS